jgi:serine phosphatase RsbU (regulator of sigma subunit)
MSTATGAHALQCMEIWQGSHGVENEVSTPGLDVWVYSRPHGGGRQGGDVHYLSLCGGGVITRLLVADVCGHGEAVAGLSRTLRSLMRKNINRKSQDRLVAALNREFSAFAQEQGRFATAVAATYLTSGDSLAVCNAGHPRPLWYHAAQKRWSVLAAESSLPLGVDEHSAYNQVHVILGKGDAVVFCTDALTEARNAAGQALGEEGLLRLAAGLVPTGARQVGRELLAAVDCHRGEAAPDDDVTLLVLHHNAGPCRPPSLVETLGVYAKVLGLKKV